MRDIKFKGICADTGKVVYGYGVILCEDISQIIHKQGINIMQHTNVVADSVSQWTGRTTKDGQNIYENDKVLVKGRKRIGEYETTVVFHQNGFQLAENKTYFNDDAALIAVIKVL